MRHQNNIIENADENESNFKSDSSFIQSELFDRDGPVSDLQEINEQDDNVNLHDEEDDSLDFYKNYDNLNRHVDHIKTSFKNILNKHEEDFIRAYKVRTPLLSTNTLLILVIHGESAKRARLLAKEVG